MIRSCFDCRTRSVPYILVLVIACVSQVIQADLVKVGEGGYLTTVPKPCKPLPEKIFKTPDLKGPILTAQWWSSIVWQPYSQPLFAHPLFLRCSERGLTVGYPGSKITSNKSGIFGSGASSDFTIGHSAIETFPRADCGGFSDWFVKAVFSSGTSSLRTSFGHGSPYVFCRITGGNPTVTFRGTPKIWSGADSDSALGVTINGHHYAFFGPSSSTWSGLDGTRFVNNADDKDYFSVALLPDDNPQTLALFRRYAYNHVRETRVEYDIDKGIVKAKYCFMFSPTEGSDEGTLFAMYPHQWKYTTSKLTGMTYGSVRGLMKLGQGGSFSTEVPIQGVLPMLPAEGIPNRQRMIGYLKAQADRNRGRFGDTYWEGKHLGKLATLSGIAEAIAVPDLRERFVNEIKRRLEEWFTAEEGKEQPVFYYNADWGVLVGSRPSYGSDRPLNDHHFHHGYFIRAAAEVARFDKAWARKWSSMVNLLIRDIASTDRNDAMFPYLRCFDKYAGHSWASGDANFGDGNNQESSSESMNAWYGMILWGQLMGDSIVRDTGLFLFNTERTAVEEYWFDVSGTNYPKDFPNIALGMVWGGKGAFGTWFSGDIDCIHGINWLPFTPASLYLGRHPDYVKKNHDRVVSVRKGGKDYNNGWGDLVCMFNALQDPATAAAYMDANHDCKVESGNTRAFMYHWISTLNNIGLNDPSITADYPLATVLNKDGSKTYMAYNTTDEPLVVTFSDGYKLTAKSNQLTLYSDMEQPQAVAEVAKRAEAPDFGSNVVIFDPTQPDIQKRVDAVFNQQERAQFGSGRFALLFKPGRYKLKVEVGFYTHVAGLGRLPGDVTIDGAVRTDASWMRYNATCNFWRCIENLTVIPRRDRGGMMWAVSQAAPMRRTHIQGDLHLSSGGWSSGGFLADCKIDGTVFSGSQQQYLSRNTQWDRWSGGVWNMVFVGVTNPPSGQWPRFPYTVVDNTPVVREKPFLHIDDDGGYSVFVPSLGKNRRGITWENGDPKGRSIPIDQFHIAHADKDTAASMNSALAQGKHLLLTPGIYELDDTIRVDRAATVILGLGLATLKPNNGRIGMMVADVDGVTLAGILFDAGAENSPILLEIGPEGSSENHSSNPTFCHDIFCRVGGAGVGKATISVSINSNDVIGDHFWIWRADHGRGAGWSSNTTKNGLVVNGNNVMIFGLFVEHYHEYQTLWQGNGGRVYFYQNEFPYDPPSQEQWEHDGVNGYAAYKVADSVTSHQAWGLGSYCTFHNSNVVSATRSFEVPVTSDVRFHHLVTVSLGGKGLISHVINNTGGPSNRRSNIARVTEFPTED